MNKKFANNKMVSKGEGTVRNKVVKAFKDFWKEEDGMGSVEVILIVVILIGLVVIFRDTIQPIIQNAIKSIKSQGGDLNVSSK